MRLLAIALPVLVLGLAYVLDVPRGWGAHPWWSQNVILYGAPVGIGLAFLSNWLMPRAWVLALGFAVTAGLSYAAAKWGQRQFGASFAEDAFAGQVWFLGWIAVALFAAATLTALGLALIQPRRSA